MLSLKAQIMVAEETLAIAQDAKVSHLQIQSNLQKTHQDAAFMTHFGKIYSATIPDLELLRKT
jgi:LPS O-antigen subunit length determinant protein (WzzB/FepE family)